MSGGTVTTPAGVTAAGTRTGGAPRGRAPVRGQPGARPGGAPAGPRTRPAGQRPRAGAPITGVGRARPAAAARPSRMPFIVLIVGLLGGGLLCLLLINTILDTGSYQISSLQQQNVTLAQQTQALQAQIAHEESPAVLAAWATKLGMTQPGLLHFLDLRKRRIESQPQHMAGIPSVPGYTP
jgi:cell division protein FtsB